MAAPRTIAGRIGTRRGAATGAVAASLAALLLAIEIPASLLSAGGASSALAELLARSPGARVGGVALKAKERRGALAPIATEATLAESGTPASPIAAVIGSGAGPEGAIPTSGPGGFPADFTAPDVPGELAAPPAAVAGPGAPVTGGTPISGGGLAFFAPGGGGAAGSPPGGGGGIIDTTPNPTDTPPGPTDTTPIGPPTGTVPGIPEPSTWALLIAGFGMTGAAMRRKRRAAIA